MRDAAGTSLMMVRALTWRNSIPRNSPVPDVALDQLVAVEQRALATGTAGAFLVDQPPAQLAARP